MEYMDYNPMNDVLFKYIFGREEHKHILISFLNAVLDRKDETAIKDVQFRNVELPPVSEYEKLSRLDIFAVLDNKERVDIEVQVANHLNMEKRSLFYWANMFLHFDGIKKGGNYMLLKPTISINLLRYNFLPQENPHTVYGLFERETHHKLTDVLEIHFLEVLKLKRKPIKQMNVMERWLAFLSNKLNREQKEELAMNEPIVNEAMDAAEIYLKDEKSYLEYVNREGAIFDYNTDMIMSRQEGILEGIIEGEAKAEAKFSDLTRILLNENKLDELKKATSDRNYLQKLYKEYNIE